MTTLTSCKKQLPEQVTISGFVTFKDGLPLKNVRVVLGNNPSAGEYEKVGVWYTDDNGYYEVVFEPDRTLTPYKLFFSTMVGNKWCSDNLAVNIWKAKQEINVVLREKK